MIPLPTEFRYKGFDFVQIAREGRHAIFRKSKPANEFAVFEVVIIQETPERERLPGNRLWGKQGWTFQTQESAWKKFRENAFLSSFLGWETWPK